MWLVIVADFGGDKEKKKYMATLKDYMNRSQSK